MFFNKNIQFCRKRRILKREATTIKRIKGAMNDPVFLGLYKDKDRFKRNRLLPMVKVLMYLLFTSKASMFQNTARIRDELPKLKFPNVSKQAVSKARMGILPDCFLALSRICVETFYKQRKHSKSIYEHFISRCSICLEMVV